MQTVEIEEEKQMQTGHQVFKIGSPFSVKQSDARFTNPKQEFLNNSYAPLAAVEWNQILRKCVMFAKSRQAKSMGFNLKEIVALKLYIDNDALQREFRKCFRDNDKLDRIERQKQFYFWNGLLENVSNKPEKEIIAKEQYSAMSPLAIYFNQHECLRSNGAEIALTSIYYGTYNIYKSIICNQYISMNMNKYIRSNVHYS